MSETIEELLNSHEDFAKKCIKDKGDFLPQVIMCKDKKISVMVVATPREGIRAVLDLVQKSKPEWVVFISEGYMRVTKDKEALKNYETGELEKGFNSGDKTISEVVIIHAYTKTQKMARIIDKKTWKKVEKDTENFAGFLTINDVDRTFW